MNDLTTTDDTARLMELALQQGESGVAALERLVAMRERAEERAAAQAYAAAVAGFQADCPLIGKDAEGAHRAKYATLDHIMASIRPALDAHGLSVTYDTDDAEGDRLKVWAIVRHVAGHSERASFTVSREAKSNRMNDTQRDGSALSYGRRYALAAALGITVGERDDDGAGAGAPDEPCITAEQAATLQALADEVGANVPRAFNFLKITQWSELKASRYQKAVAALERKR